MQWEYRTVRVEVVTPKTLDKNLEDHGNDGFELVTIIGPAIFEGSKKETLLIFKKPKN